MDIGFSGKNRLDRHDPRHTELATADKRNAAGTALAAALQKGQERQHEPAPENPAGIREPNHLLGDHAHPQRTVADSSQELLEDPLIQGRG